MEIMSIYFLILLALCNSSELFEEYYEEASKYLQNMTIEQKIGQMFITQFYPPVDYNNFPEVTPGGYLLFATAFNYDAKYIKENIKKMQRESIKNTGLPLAFCVDEEGGKVVRVSKYFRDTPFPSPQQIYNESGIEGILVIDQEKRNLLRDFYMNVNLAPVADISLNYSDPINYRTLFRDANETAQYISKDVEGYVNDNFTCCLKHFPGYSNNLDTHTNKSIDKRDYNTFLNEDFLPFKAGITQKVPMVLISHNIVICKDTEYPTSLSKEWHRILREDLHFSGIIITDDLSMGAIKLFYNLSTAAILGVQAGNDLIITGYYKTQYNAVLEAVKNGTISEDLINTAVKRIIAWKLKYFSKTGYNEEPSDTTPVNNQEEPKDKTTLIVILCVIGGVIIIGIIILVITLYRKKTGSADIESVEKMELLK